MLPHTSRLVLVLRQVSLDSLGVGPRLLAASKLASVEQLHVRKRKAVELEDYELLGKLDS